MLGAASWQRQTLGEPSRGDGRGRAPRPGGRRRASIPISQNRVLRPNADLCAAWRIVPLVARRGPGRIKLEQQPCRQASRRPAKPGNLDLRGATVILRGRCAMEMRAALASEKPRRAWTPGLSCKCPLRRRGVSPDHIVDGQTIVLAKPRFCQSVGMRDRDPWRRD